MPCFFLSVTSLFPCPPPLLFPRLLCWGMYQRCLHLAATQCWHQVNKFFPPRPEPRSSYEEVWQQPWIQPQRKVVRYKAVICKSVYSVTVLKTWRDGTRIGRLALKGITSLLKWQYWFYWETWCRRHPRALLCNVQTFRQFSFVKRHLPLLRKSACKVDFKSIIVMLW